MLLAISFFAISGIAGCRTAKVQSDNVKLESQSHIQKDAKEETMESDDKKSEKSSVDNGWQQSYKDIITYAKEYLVDPYGLREGNGSDRWAYVSLHDFNNDGIPELILGDSVSISIFTYQNNKAEKVIDLYEPEGWYSINNIYYRRNSLFLVSNGTSGSGYVCLTYKDGKYVTGFYDDYNPTMAAVNEEDTTYREFGKIFNISDLSENEKVPLVMLDANYEDITIRIKEGEPNIPLSKIDLSKLSL